MKATYKRIGGYWHGAIKDGKTVVWVCEHAHHNRDLSSFSRGRSAVDCAYLELKRRQAETQEVRS